MSASPSTPAPAVQRPAWKDALFNYGTLVATILAVFATLFGQLHSLQNQVVRIDERLSGLGQRMDRSEKAADQRFAAIEARLDKHEQRLEQIQATLVEHGLILREIVVELRQLREQKKP